MQAIAYLDNIIAKKQQEVARLKSSQLSFKKALKGNTLKIIGEIKRRSPSKGHFGEIADPVELAQKYAAGGAAAISILTDEGFGGTIEDLAQVSSALPKTPILRKDFLIDPIQIKEAAAAGATAVLLIVTVLGNKTAEMVKAVHEHGLEALVEIFNEEELKIAIDAGAEVIAVNNRNLKTFEVNLAVCERIAPLIPDSVVKVAASGMFTVEDVRRMKKAGYDAVLIGEALVKAPDPKRFIEEICR